MERVSVWRKLYTGVRIEKTNALVRYSLQQSAKLVGISKKSLDDYLLQVRFGKTYNFDFKKHANDHIGVLRRFVRDKKKTKRS